MKTILTGLPMYAYWPGRVFVYVGVIEVCVCVVRGWVCGARKRVCVWHVYACGYLNACIAECMHVYMRE